MNIIEQFEREQMSEIAAKRAIPEFAPGDTVRVLVKVVEGKTVRNQAYEGVVIGRAGAGLNENFTVRKISYGEGVERVFPLYSPLITDIEVVRRGKVRRAKLYYLRGRRGRSARIAERTDVRAKRLNAAFKGFKKQKGERDELIKINGLTPEMQTALYRLNLTRYEQMAALSDDDIANIEEVLKIDGVVERENWVGEAQRLMAEATVDEVPAEEPADGETGGEGEAQGS